MISKLIGKKYTHSHFKYRVPYFIIFLGGVSVWKGFKIWVKIREIKSSKLTLHFINVAENIR